MTRILLDKAILLFSSRVGEIPPNSSLDLATGRQIPERQLTGGPTMKTTRIVSIAKPQNEM